VLTALLVTQYKHNHLREFILGQTGTFDVEIAQGRISFEARCLKERHHLIQLVAWLLGDVENRLEEAFRAGAIRYNLFLKDFKVRPCWYEKIIQKFPHWRQKNNS
jgi:hypothetical protein